MLCALLKYSWLPISQVSHTGPLVPLPLLPPIILPSSCSQTPLPPFTHRPIPKCAHYHPFYTPLCTPIAFFSPSPPFFRFFCMIVTVPLLPAPLPTFIHHSSWFSHSLPMSASPSYLSFRIFLHYYAAPATSTSPPPLHIILDCFPTLPPLPAP
jgi:hypothetical protein